MPSGFLRHRRAQLILAAIILLALVGVGFLLQDVFSEIGESLNAYSSEHPILGPILFALLAAGSVMLGPFTSAPLVPLAVFLWRPLATLGLLLAGWIVGNAVVYAVGLYLGHPVVRKLAPAKKLDEWIQFVSTEIDIRLLFLFRLVSPSELGYVFGILKYDFWKYMGLTFLSELPVALALVYAGEAFVTNNWFLLGAFGILWIVILLLSVQTIHRFRQKKSA
jgi:uncharacterized membrane protein YdjX (TVP38/TMEM64 family)